ncbi:hypothetical protein EMCG_03834 [[Emmonsia] crescens]|uniref:Dynamin GTPase n=1 Tax=[Emmonsia] crescens TaxID=73230 RepID=A0A0G2IZP9_9EURO|nr:hypothetical protein EMCG_03834 [Emmonsia crescens UAMH 3008]
MLMVVPANVDIVTQEIVKMAKKMDPGGERILRVLTKPDLVDKDVESAILDLITEKKSQSNIQWNNRFDDHSKLCIATKVVHRAELFETHIDKWGHRFNFEADQQDPLSGLVSPPPDERGSDHSESAAQVNFEARQMSNLAALDDILHSAESVPPPL